jgi:hypothetical protein
MSSKNTVRGGEGDKPFLQILKTFDYCQVHNMLALMLDPRYNVGC